MRFVDVYPYRTKAQRHEFLIFKRSAQKRYAGQWRMVGGKIEKGEQAWKAGLREFKGETAVTPELYWVVPSLNHFYNHRNDRIEFIPAFAARLPFRSDIRLNEEHSDYKEQRRLMCKTDWKIINL